MAMKDNLPSHLGSNFELALWVFPV